MAEYRHNRLEIQDLRWQDQARRPLVPTGAFPKCRAINPQQVGENGGGIRLARAQANFPQNLAKARSLRSRGYLRGDSNKGRICLRAT